MTTYPYIGIGTPEFMIKKQINNKLNSRIKYKKHSMVWNFQKSQGAYEMVLEKSKKS